MRVWEAETIERERVVRYADLVPCLNAFIDTRNPGSEAKENFTIIGPAFRESEPACHIAEPHGFNIGGARQPPGCVNSQHSHNTAEVFVVHSGRWRFTLGERGEDASVECGPGDVISLPTGMFRGFTNIGEEVGYLFAVLGGDDPGRVLWAPYVFDMAEKFGLVLLSSGALVDTHAGEAVPEGAGLMPRTSREQVAAMHVPSPEEARRWSGAPTGQQLPPWLR
jgi:mannose-6-phosphate isomerase-like protein (cupin superfamily)